jgi:hypothetical protein
VGCSIRVLFPVFSPSILKVPAGLDFHNRRSATGGKELTISALFFEKIFSDFKKVYYICAM